MNIFDLLNNILFEKKEIVLSELNDDKNISVYMLNRWISMLDKNAAQIINSTTNRYASVFETKQDAINFLQGVLPKYRNQRINYIKKPSLES